MTSFWDNVKTGRAEDCWEWLRSGNGRGYGLYWNSKTGARVYAHRMSYELARGVIPDGQQVLHKCDNPRCVNPNHLFLGTHTDNMRDMFRKGRRKTNKTRGERHPLAVFTNITAQKVRQLYSDENVTQVELAKFFGVSQSTISRVICHQSYA